MSRAISKRHQSSSSAAPANAAHLPPAAGAAGGVRFAFACRGESGAGAGGCPHRCAGASCTPAGGAWKATGGGCGCGAERLGGGAGSSTLLALRLAVRAASSEVTKRVSTSKASPSAPAAGASSSAVSRNSAQRLPPSARGIACGASACSSSPPSSYAAARARWAASARAAASARPSFNVCTARRTSGAFGERANTTCTDCLAPHTLQPNVALFLPPRCTWYVCRGASAGSGPQASKNRRGAHAALEALHRHEVERGLALHASGLTRQERVELPRQGPHVRQLQQRRRDAPVPARGLLEGVR